MLLLLVKGSCYQRLQAVPVTTKGIFNSQHCVNQQGINKLHRHETIKVS